MNERDRLIAGLLLAADILFNRGELCKTLIEAGLARREIVYVPVAQEELKNACFGC